MKHLVFRILVLQLVALCLICPSWAAGPVSFTSGAAVLMDADTGEVLWSHNKDKQLYPASITKVLTGLLVAESCDMADTVTARVSALRIPQGYAHIALQDGDRLSVDDAMYAMMLASANDAANVLSDHISGSKKAFAAKMNSRAQEIGATRSNFTNASGVPDKKHYTTAYDMALITREAIKNDTFARYFGTARYTLPQVNASTKAVELKNYQYMLLEDEDVYYPDVVGGKIGYTPQAKHTMCTVARRDGRTLVCVVLDSTRNGKYQDTKTLLDYGFSL